MNGFRLYLEMMKVQLQSVMEYKTDFIINILSEIISNSLWISFIWIMFLNIPSINGWSLPQVLFIVGLSALSWGISSVLFFQLFELEGYILEGAFDRFMTKPINIMLQLITSRVYLTQAGDIIVGLALILITSSMLGIQWNIFNISLFAILIASGVVIIFSLLLIPASIGFWTTKSNALMSIVTRFSNISEYPLEIYNFATVFFISFVIPFAFVNYYPAQLFIGKGIAPSFAYLTPIVAIITFAIAYSIWKLGLKNYQSTGS